jgi:hypothetical protein
MKPLKVTLYARLTERPNAQGKLCNPWLRIITEKAGRAINPKEPADAASYFLRVAGKVESLDVRTFSEAITALRNRQAACECVALGVDAPKQLTEHAYRLTVADAVAKFLLEKRTLSASNNTMKTYTRECERFRDNCGKAFFDQIDRDAILKYIDWMRDNIKTKAGGNIDGGIHGRLTVLAGVWVVISGHKGEFPLAFKDWPRAPKREPTILSDDELAKMVDAADDDEKDMLLFSMSTGMRVSELAHASYSNIDFSTGVVKVVNKPTINTAAYPTSMGFLRSPSARSATAQDVESLCSIIWFSSFDWIVSA